MNIEQERADFESWYRTEFSEDISDSTFIYYESCNRYQRPYIDRMWEAYKAGRAALQSQPPIDEDHLSIVLDVYDNAMQKAFEGREFPNPCKPGTPEHKAWEKGSKEGKKKRDAGLPNSIALQSQAQIPAPTNRDEYIALLDRAIDMGKQLNVMWEEAFAEVGVKHGLQSQDAEDAERYRWLRNGRNYKHNFLIELGGRTDRSFDAAIDHARCIEGEE